MWLLRKVTRSADHAAPPAEGLHATTPDVIAEEDGEQGKELVIHFAYRPATLTDCPEGERDGKKKPPVQKDLIALAAKHVLATTDPALTEWVVELGKPHVMANGEQADYSRLEAHLKRYTARNTFDYFIHKDLGSFLCRARNPGDGYLTALPVTHPAWGAWPPAWAMSGWRVGRNHVATITPRTAVPNSLHSHTSQSGGTSSN